MGTVKTWSAGSGLRGSAAQGALTLLIDGLATYRLTKLIRHDKITEPVREAVQESQGPPEKSKVSYLMDCPWCLSFYFGTALTLARHRWPEQTSLFARSFALSAITGIASQYLED